MTTNNLVGKSEKELVQEDKFLSSLTTVAYASPKSIATTNLKKDRSSSFWFTLETSAQAISRRKAAVAPTPAEHIDTEVVARLATYETEISPALREKIVQVREFFLMEIAPLTLASSGGAIQSREVAQRMLDTEIDGAIFSRFENMVNRAATIKLGLFVLDYFGLPKDYFDSLVMQGNQKSPAANPELQAIMAALGELRGSMRPTNSRDKRQPDPPKEDT